MKVVPHPTASDASYSQLARVFTSKSSSFDVAMIDVLWPGAFAPYLVDLKPKLGNAGEAARGRDHRQRHGRGAAGRDAVVRRLRDPVLPHRPAEEVRLQEPADDLDPALRDGEEDPGRRAEGNANFSGFVFQGNCYEGLTCDALEWYQSTGAGGFIDNGKVTINNTKAAAILDLFAAQIGMTTPRGVTSYQEGEATPRSSTGNAAFMRNWPYAYSVGPGSEVSRRSSASSA